MDIFTPTEVPAPLVRWAWVPIPLFLFLIAAFRFADLSFAAEPRYLLPVLNFVFCTAVSLFVAHLAALGFSRNGSFTVLLLGCGMLFFGVVSLVAPVAVHLGDVNAALTVYNTGSSLSAACHFLAATTPPGVRKRAGRRNVIFLSGAYGLVLAVSGMLTLAAFQQATPLFFVQGQGATPLRQAVVAAAVLLFALSGVLVRRFSYEYHRAFGRWYALSLGLLATGFFGVLLITHVGSPLGWVCRAAQYLGGVYMLLAVVSAFRKSGEWESALQVALRESRERYRVLAEATFEGIVVCDDGVIVDCNGQFSRMLGYSEGELAGTRFSDLIPEGGRDRFRTEPDSGAVLAEEHPLLRKDGRSILVESHNRSFLRNGKRVRYFAIRDVTETRRHQAELETAKAGLEEKVALRTAELEKRTHLLQRLSLQLSEAEAQERERLARLLHDDLQQVLASVRMRLAMLMEPGRCTVETDPVIGNCIGLLEQSISKMRKMSHELSPPLLRRAGLLASLDGLADEMRANHGLSVQYRRSGNAEPDSKPVAVFLYQALRELLFNVVKHSGANAARVELTARDDRIEVRVVDGGRGGDLDRIFAARGSACGFGLFSIEERARALGGEMSIETEPGGGWTTTLVFPKAPAAG